MKYLALPLLLVLSVGEIFAFNAEEWHLKRGVLTQEAERLKNAYEKYSQIKAEPADGVVIPVETFPDGSVKLTVTAKRAKLFLKAGFVIAEDVVITKYNDEHEVDTRIEAGRCLVDRNSSSGWIAGEAKITHGKTEFTGVDFYFSSSEGYMISMKKSKIVSTDMKIGGVL